MDENFQSCLRIWIVHQNRRDHTCLHFLNRGLKLNQKSRIHRRSTPNFFILEVQNFEEAAQIFIVDENFESWFSIRVAYRNRAGKHIWFCSNGGLFSCQQDQLLLQKFEKSWFLEFENLELLENLRMWMKTFEANAVFQYLVKIGRGEYPFRFLSRGLFRCRQVPKLSENRPKSGLLKCSAFLFYENSSI